MSYELGDFRVEVLEASTKHPVLVDFWAPWCGPCKVLSPILEHQVEKAGGAWSLVKINVDEHGEIASQFGISGIPAVFLIFQGGVVANFSGGQTQDWIEVWLKENLPSEGLDEEDKDEIDDMVGGQVAALEAELAANPNDTAVKLALACAIMYEDVTRAETLLADISETAPEFDRVQHLGWFINSLNMAPTSLPDHPKLKPHFEVALTAVKNADFEAALDAFLEVLYRDREYAEDGARKAILGVFAFLGRHHEIPTRYYRRFEMALF